MSENERQSQTNVAMNDKLQGTVVTYLRCAGLSITKLRKVIAQSAREIFFKSVNTWHSYRKKVDCVVHFLRLLALWWPGLQPSSCF